MDEQKRDTLIQFVREVNAEQRMNALPWYGGNTEPFRQFIIEVDILSSMSAETWFAEARNQTWVKQIEGVYDAYTASLTEAEKHEQPNKVEAELKRLKAQVKALLEAQEKAVKAESAAPDAQTKPTEGESASEPTGEEAADEEDESSPSGGQAEAEAAAEEA